jgi:hypothetical protein
MLKGAGQLTNIFTQRASIPKDVMVRDVAGESVILNLNTETYFGLDEVGTRMWNSLQQGRTIQEAYEDLIGEYDIDPATLRNDFQKLIENLVKHGLLALIET